MRNQEQISRSCVWIAHGCGAEALCMWVGNLRRTRAPRLCLNVIHAGVHAGRARRRETTRALPSITCARRAICNRANVLNGTFPVHLLLASRSLIDFRPSPVRTTVSPAVRVPNCRALPEMDERCASNPPHTGTAARNWREIITVCK